MRASRLLLGRLWTSEVTSVLDTFAVEEERFLLRTVEVVADDDIACEAMVKG